MGVGRPDRRDGRGVGRHKFNAEVCIELGTTADIAV